MKPTESASGDAEALLCVPLGVRFRLRLHEVLERSRPSDQLGWLVDVGLLALIVLNVAAVLAESVESLRQRYAAEFLTFELISVAAFTMEYLARVWAAVEQPRFRNSGSSFSRRLRYVVTPMAIVDLLAVLPFYLALFGVMGAIDMRFMRVLRLARILKLSRYSESMTLLLLVLRENARNFAAALGVLLILMIIAASGIHLFERAAQPEDFGSIPAAMWWAFATLTTVGYGDVTPVTAGGKVFGAVITVVSVGMVALPAGILASSFSERLRLKSSSYRQLADRAYADGVLTAEEYAQLEAQRDKLGIGEDLAATILQEEHARATARCPHCGHGISEASERESSQRMRG